MKNKMNLKSIRHWVLLLASTTLLAACTNDANDTETTSEEVVTESVTEESISTLEEPQETESVAEESEESAISAEDGEEVTATISIIIDGEEQSELSQEVIVQEGTTLMEAMEEYFDIEYSDGMITSIDSHEQDVDAGRYWLYDVNGEMATVGAGDYELAEGDLVEWKLEDSDF
ncbi:DUF4430 domain-containing protein [Aerococcaceae bacterium DSM 111020]|nr:DUF4430 domain-containing protein [Aerococcaceae bacterium DSM 111020]